MSRQVEWARGKASLVGLDEVVGRAFFARSDGSVTPFEGGSLLLRLRCRRCAGGPGLRNLAPISLAKARRFFDFSLLAPAGYSALGTGPNAQGGIFGWALVLTKIQGY